ncbi:MAG: c-type cytochrome [Casimicrobium sp.]
MRKYIAVLAAFGASLVIADGGPQWAYPVADKEQPVKVDDNEIRRVIGSALAYKRKEIDDLFNPPIWFPEQNVGMPRIVQYGAPPNVRACAACHLASGQGHPESGHIAGLPVNYFKRQIDDFRNGRRNDPVWMNKMSVALSDADVQAAAEWFSKVKPINWVQVVETDTIPKSFFNKSRKRLPHPDGGTEPLGERIAEFPREPERVLDRDPNAGFVAYVPKGSIARGKSLVLDGSGGKTVACSACHGTDLRGQGDVPRIAGVSPLYTVRQLYAFKTASRKGEHAAQMTPVVANLVAEDINAIAAYIATLTP